MTGPNEELTQPVSLSTKYGLHFWCVMLAPYFAAATLGFIVGYMVGGSGPNGMTSILPGILSLAGAGALAIGSKGHKLGICTSSFLLVLFLIFLLIGTQIGSWRRDIFAREELAEAYAHDGSRYVEGLKACSIQEFKINVWRKNILNLPPLTFSEICPSMATVKRPVIK